MSLDKQELLVGWYCGHYVGLPVWQGEFYEPLECEATFETQETMFDWSHNRCTTICPNCGAELWQTDDLPEIIEENIQ